MKKYLCILLSLIMTVTMLSSCGEKEEESKKEEKSSSDESTTSPATENIEDEKKDTVTVWLIDEVIFSSSTKKYLYDDNYCFMGEEIANSDGTTNKTIHNDYKYDKNGNPLHMQYDVVVKYTEKYNEYSDITECIQIFEDYDFETDTSTETTDIITYEYEYDENGNYLKKTEYINGEKRVETTRTYNKNGDILTENVYNGGNNHITTYSYDKNGNLISESNSYSKTTYIYDSDGKIIRKDSCDLDGTVYGSDTYEYDSEGNYTVTTPGQLIGYDKHGNVISLKYIDSSYDNDVSITYKAVEVTPVRAKAIERHKDMVFYGLFQR